MPYRGNYPNASRELGRHYLFPATGIGRDPRSGTCGGEQGGEHERRCEIDAIDIGRFIDQLESLSVVTDPLTTPKAFNRKLAL